MRGERIRDFVVGFLGIMVLDGALLLAASGLNAMEIWGVGVTVLDVALVIAALALKRPYIALGIVASIVMPMLLVAACFAVFTAVYRT